MKKKFKIIYMCILAAICLWGGVILLWKITPLKYKLLVTLYIDRPQLLMCKDDVDRLDIVRDWVYENVPFAWNGDTYREEEPDHLLEKIVNHQDIDFGYYCGWTAQLLYRVYEIMGYSACCLDMAIAERDNILASHVVTLVYVDESWIVEDATFNITYTDGQGNHLDVVDLKEYYMTGSEYAVYHGDTLYKQMIFADDSYISYYDLQSGKEDAYKKNGKYYYTVNMDINKNLQFGMPEAIGLLKRNGYEINEAVWYAFPYDIYFCPETETGDLLKKRLNL